jgi:TrmH family RNA methyltransferase
MISAAELKHLQSLKLKKFRQKYGHFLVEGEKVVAELLQSPMTLDYILATSAMAEKIKPLTSGISVKEVTEKNYAKISSLSTPPGIAALIKIPETKSFAAAKGRTWALALDGIRDPGNLGTIIRIADWYGIKEIFCSEDCVDLYNPKVLSATMGSFIRVSVVYTDLKKVITVIGLPALAFVMDGQDLNEVSLPYKGLIVIGNESKGISEGLKELCDYKVKITRLGAAESLNAAIATAIACERLVNR